jgi:Uma2 family endonuclease
VAQQDNLINEPEPDLIVTTKSLREYAGNPQPEDLRLVAEVSNTTVSFDLKLKAKLYARAGIQEYWVINIPEKKLIVHREPKDGSYTSVGTYASNEEVRPFATEAGFCLDKL